MLNFQNLKLIWKGKYRECIQGYSSEWKHFNAHKCSPEVSVCFPSQFAEINGHILAHEGK